MKAACYKQLGGPEVLEILDLEIPEPGPGEVRVKVNVSGVNPSDWKARRNGRGGGMGFDMIIPHSDGSGTVDAVGDGVESSLIGEKVWMLMLNINDHLAQRQNMWWFQKIMYLNFPRVHLLRKQHVLVSHF